MLGDYAARSRERTQFLEVLAAAAIGVFLLLQAAFGSWRLATLAFLALPVALVGGLVALLIDGGTLSLGSIAGFLVVFAIAARAGTVWINRAQALGQTGEEQSVREVVRLVTRERFVPILTTAVGGALVLLPLLLFGHTAGYELSHPLAVVVLGGLVTSTLVNVLVIPGLYVRFGAGPVSRVTVDIPALEVAAGDGNSPVDVASTTVSDA